MTLVRWPDGLERGPDGPCRQIPCRHVWSSTAWITQDGSCRRRHYNALTGMWSWDDQPQPAAMNEDQSRMGFVIDHCISMERAVLMAWTHRHPDSPNSIVEDDIVLEGRDDEGLPFAWRVGEVVDRARTIEAETFKPLKWRCGLCPCPKGYKISTRGRLMNPGGRVTAGFFYQGDRYAAVRGSGLVNLTVAAGLRENTVHMSDSLWFACEALMTGKTPAQHARAAAIMEQTSWSYFCRMAPFVGGAGLRKHVPPLVSTRLWKVLQSMRSDPALGGPLHELLPVVQARLRSASDFRAFPMEQLRLARLSVLAP